MSVLELSGLGNYKTLLENTLQDLLNEKIIERIWEKDYTVWSDDPAEISNRLGWLNCVENSQKSLPEIYEFVKNVKVAGFKNALVLGMGGSSLAPEVFSLIFGREEKMLDVFVLDSTHPEAVKNYAEKLNPKETLYIVSTKSGGTVETLSFMKFFYNYVLNQLGESEVGKHFAAITDPGSGLQKIAEELKFGKIFLNDPNIGGRYSALSLFGLVPAALTGVDLEKLLYSAETSVNKSKITEHKRILDNNSAVLGALIGALAEKNINKLTLIYSDSLKNFGAWLEQLIAESTGKNGKGIVPVDLEEVVPLDYYGNDRVFVYTRLKNEHPYEKFIFDLKQKGLPVVEIILEDIYSLGAEFFNWEMATAIAGWKMKLQPFDQPNVESAKVQARNLLSKYQKEGKLPQPETSFEDANLIIYASQKIDSISEALGLLFSDIKAGDYVSLQSFVNPTEEALLLFSHLRSKILKKYKTATTFGFGPRFLHSTGQLHKGDNGSGIFLQFIESGKLNLGIPNEALSSKSDVTFDVLIRAQALGDREALLQAKRRVVTIEVKKDLPGLLNKLNTLL